MNVKSEIVQAGQRLYQAQLVASNDGNISSRCEDGTVWCTPSGVSKGFMSEDMLIRMDLNGNVIEGGNAGSLRPSSEIKMHLGIYRENPEITAVVHAHPPVATTFASAGIPLDSAVLQETVVQLGVVPLVPYALPGTAELAGSVAPYCRVYNAALMEYHGVTSWGSSVTQALHRMESVEYFAKILMNLRMINAERPMTAEQIDGLLALRPDWGVSGGGRPRGRN